LWEFNKIYLFLFLTLFALFLWLAKMVLSEKKIKFRGGILSLLVFIFLAAGVISSFFSADKESSLLGFYGRFSDGLIFFLGLGIFD